jgi:hypothetical protein
LDDLGDEEGLGDDEMGLDDLGGGEKAGPPAGKNIFSRWMKKKHGNFEGI